MATMMSVTSSLSMLLLSSDLLLAAGPGGVPERVGRAVGGRVLTAWGRCVGLRDGDWVGGGDVGSDAVLELDADVDVENAEGRRVGGAVGEAVALLVLSHSHTPHSTMWCCRSVLVAQIWRSPSPGSVAQLV